MRKYIFGPVPSRRLGLSLGVDLTPSKTCSLNCRYCQLSETTQLTLERKAFCQPEAVLKELSQTLNEISPPDWITFSGTGEPTLHSGIGFIIQEIKKMTRIPVCVITNGSLLADPWVRNELLEADKVLPTLSTTNEETFRTIHRPPPGLLLENILAGLAAFSDAYDGILEVEIFVCRGLNDGEPEIRSLGEFLRSLPHLDAVYLNTSVRQPVDLEIRPASNDDLVRFRMLLDVSVPVSLAFDPPLPRTAVAVARRVREEEIVLLLRRHPCTIQQIVHALGTSKKIVERVIRRLFQKGKIFAQADETWAAKS